MSASDWAAIKALQDDLLRAQQSSTSHRLSERNCVELISKLVEKGLIEIIHTCDGREYLTPKQLEREIRDELIVHGGRVNLVDLQQATNVDLSHVDSRVGDLVRHDGRLCLVQGELIDRDYLDRVAEEINQTLQASGQLSVVELSKSFGLPAEFLLSHIESSLGSSIHGQLDHLERGKLYTDAYVARHKARIRGVFSAVTRPTPVASLISQFGFEEKLFYSVFHEMVSEGRLAGVVQGRQDKAVFVPDIYTRTQLAWVESFYSQNGYIEFDTLSRLGITDGQKFLLRHYTTNPPLMLSTCAVGPSLIGQAEAAVDEALRANSWFDLAPIVPSPFTDLDCQQLLQHILSSASHRSVKAHIFCGSMLTSDQFVQNCGQVFQDIMYANAEKYATAKVVSDDASRSVAASMAASGGSQDRKEEKRQKGHKASGSGGHHGREAKTQKSKEKKLSGSRARGRQADGGDAEVSQNLEFKELSFLSEEKIGGVLSDKLPDLPESLVEELASYLQRPLTRSYQEVARSVFLSSSTRSGSSRRQHNTDIMARLSSLWTNVHLFNKGITFVEGEDSMADLQVLLSRHLLRTLGTELVNIVCSLLAEEHLMQTVDADTMDNEGRASILAKLPANVKMPLVNLSKSLNNKTTSEFLEKAEAVSDQLNLNLRKADRKRERQIVFQHKNSLSDELCATKDAAVGLHLAVLLLFQQHSHCLLHAPGRCVPHLVSLLQKYLPPDDHFKLLAMQQLVVKSLAKRTEATSAVSSGDASPSVEEKSVATVVEDDSELLQALSDVRGIALGKRASEAAT